MISERNYLLFRIPKLNKTEVRTRRLRKTRRKNALYPECFNSPKFNVIFLFSEKILNFKKLRHQNLRPYVKIQRYFFGGKNFMEIIFRFCGTLLVRCCADPCLSKFLIC